MADAPLPHGARHASLDAGARGPPEVQASLRAQRDKAAVAAAREAARRERAMRLKIQRMRRHDVGNLVPAVDDTADNVSFGDDEAEE